MFIILQIFSGVIGICRSSTLKSLSAFNTALTIVGSMGSRSLYIGGSAMLAGSEQIIDKVKELTSSELEIGISEKGHLC